MIKITAKGRKRIQRNLKGCSKVIDKGLNRVIAKAGFLVEAESKRAITKSVYTKPAIGYKRTGRLRASINTRLGRRKAVIEPHTKYAIFVHDGRGSSRSYGRRPFMEEGLEATEPRINRMLRKVSKDIKIRFKR